MPRQLGKAGDSHRAVSSVFGLQMDSVLTGSRFPGLHLQELQLLLPSFAQSPLGSLCWLAQPGDESEQMQPDSLSYLESPSKTISASMCERREGKQGQGAGVQRICEPFSPLTANLEVVLWFPKVSPLSASLAGTIEIYWV